MKARLMTSEIEIYRRQNVSIFAKKNNAAANSHSRTQFRAAAINDNFYQIVILLNVSRSNICRYDVKIYARAYSSKWKSLSLDVSITTRNISGESKVMRD